MARYGNERLDLPQYDLEAARQRIASTQPPLASWQSAGPARDIASDLVPPAIAGASLDRTGYRFSRNLRPAPAGLSVLLLDADVLARSRVADLRIVDDRGRQVPYVVEQRHEPLVVALRVPKAATNDGSVYAFSLPYASLPPNTRLVITTSARVFERDVVFRRPADESRGREQETLGHFTWRSTEADLQPPPLTFDLPTNGTRTFELVIDEGDNAPLPIAEAELLFESRALRFYHPGKPLALIYGKAGAAAPRYDLALLAPRLFAQPAREITLAVPHREKPEPESPMKRWFWLAVVSSAVILFGLLGRLLPAKS